MHRCILPIASETMSKQKLDRKRLVPWRTGVTIGLLCVGIYTIADKWQVARESVTELRHTEPSWVLLAGLCMLLTFCIAAFTYQVLALHRIKYRETLLVELAGAFVGRLLPAGLGGLGLNGDYLFRKRHTPAQATAVVSVNNLIGITAHLILLAGVVILQPDILQTIRHENNGSVTKWVAVSIAVVLLVLCTPWLRTRLVTFGKNLIVSVRQETWNQFGGALLLSISLTLTYTAILYCSARAVGIDVHLFETFMIFTIGMLVGTATPTPGGLIGTEVGLYAGLTVFGVSEVNAGAVVTLYRALTYWLPLLPGAAFLLVAQRKKLL
jgi:uncharacterized membrane protein YbhN (UPF0104 family)